MYYPLEDQGYVVASYKDGHIIEYSPNNLLKSFLGYERNERIYYGGPLNFCVKSGEKLINIVNNVIFDNEASYYSINYLATIEEQNFETPTQSRALLETPLLATPSHYVAATDGWYCTVTGITNLLQYYKDNYSADVYCGAVSSASQLRSMLNTLGYIYNGGLDIDEAVVSHTMHGVNYQGLRSYLRRNDVTNYSATIAAVTGSGVSVGLN